MKVLVYSDVQATDGHERCYADPTKSLQLWRIERMYSELKRIYDEYKCEALWDLGDTTDDRSAIPVPVIDLLCDCLEPFTGQWNLKLVGNHEQWLRSTSVHVGKMFRRYFDVIETTSVKRLNNANIACVSYHDDVNAIVDFLRRCRRNTRTVLIGHFQVAGCSMASGMAATGVPRAEMDFVNIGLLGHIHRPQTIGNLHYIGSPFQQHWGEAGEAKRVAVLDFGGSEGESVTWVPMDGFPSYRQVGFPEFVESVKESSEDRYKVVLTTLKETEKFYAHPLSNRADEAIYAYDAPAPSGELQSSEAIPRSKQDILIRYLGKNPPGDAGVVLDDAAMLEFGEGITLHK